MRGLAASCAAVLVAVALGAAALANGTVPLQVSPLELEGGEFDGARITGAWRLDSPEPDFGGISGLLVEDDEVAAITDKGSWIAARRGGDVLAPEASMQPMRGADGRTFDKSGGDAEGLARRDGRLIVSFERDHRLAAHMGDGRIGQVVQTRAMEEMSSNGGMEALANLPDGRLIAIGEQGDQFFPVFLIDAAGQVTQAQLPRLSHHDTTGADVGPDGKLYLLQRHFSVLTGFSIRVRRYDLGPDGLPDPETVETLAAWESASGIDNMEGIAAFRDAPGGPVKLWLISDDNYNAIQRTILVELEVE